MLFTFFFLACTLSIPSADPNSTEAEVRRTMHRINQLASELESSAFELESYIDEVRRTPENEADHLRNLRVHLERLEEQHGLLEQEIPGGTSSMNVNEGLPP